jgi:hypothetical protein
MIPKKLAPDLIRGGHRFAAFAKPASAGEGRSEKHALGLDPRDHAQAKCYESTVILSDRITL